MYVTTLGDYIQYPPGAEVKVLTDWNVWHHGIISWNGTVIHARKGQGVIQTSWIEFTCGNRALLLRVPQSATVRDRILQRAHSAIGVRYDLLSFNCEHFASWVWGEVPHSKQVGTAVAFAALGCVGLALAKR